MPARSRVLDRQHYDRRIWFGMIGLSVFCHLAFFSGVVLVPKLRFSKPYIPTAVEVDLVSFPLARPRASAPPRGEKIEVKKKAELKKPKVKPIPAVQTKPEEKVSLAPQKIEIKKSMKQKTYDASKAIKSAIAKIEKEAPQSRPRSVQEAIDKMESGVVKREGAAGAGTGQNALDLLDIYNAEIWHRIQKNWAFSEKMVPGQSDLEATIIVKIMKGGDIRDVWFERRSGDSYFDDSALRAVKKSDPLPPLPKAFRGPYYEVGFRFNLSELQRGL